MNRRSDWSTLALFAVTVLFIGAVGAVGYRSVIALVQAAERQTQTQETIAGIERVGRLLREAESARRGYVLTLDDIHRTICQEAGEGARSALSALRHLTDDNPRQQRLLDELEPLLHARLDGLSASIERRRTAAIEPSVVAAETRAGTLADAPIQRLLVHLSGEEHDLLVDNSQRTLARERLSRKLILGSTALALLVLIGSAALVRHASQRQRRAEQSAFAEHELLDSVVTRMGDGLIVADAQGRFVLFNPSAERLLGVGRRESTPDRWSEVYRCFRPDGVTPFPPGELPLARALLGESVDGVEIYVARPDGGRWISVSARPFHEAVGELPGGLAVFHDITEQRRAAVVLGGTNLELQRTVAALARLNAEKTTLTELGDVLHACRSLDEAYEIVAQAAARLFPASTGEVFAVNPSHNQMLTAARWGTGPPVSAPLYEPDDCWAVRRGSVHAVASSDSTTRCRHTTADGLPREVCVPLLGNEGALGVIHIVLRNGAPSHIDPPPTLEDETSTAAAIGPLVASALMSIRLRDKLRAQSIRDPLTGLFNRRYMEESLDREVQRAERAHRSIGLIMLDVDHFKKLNDQFGHAGGDAVLKDLGALLASAIRGGDIACRFGGEEFTIILPEASLEATVMRAEYIRTAVASLVVSLPGGPAASITVSQGVSAFPEHGRMKKTLLSAADDALYRAKRQGRNRVEVATAVLPAEHRA